MAGTNGRDKSAFADLIPRDGDRAFLREAFSSLPNGAVLIERIERLMQDGDNSGPYIVPRRQDRLPLSQVRAVADEYREALAAYLRGIGRADLAEEACARDVQVVGRNADFYSAIDREPFPRSEALAEVEFQFGEALAAVGDHMFALEEALLSLTKYPGVTRYLLEEVVDFPLKHEAYYRLWTGSGDLYFFKNRMLLLHEA